MKALVLHGRKDLRYEEMETPSIGDDEILVKVMSTGICGSDLPRVLGNAAHYCPIVLGHEFSGSVVQIGKNVTRWALGDDVAGIPLVPCGSCEDCQRGDYALCKHYTFIGSRIFGSFAEYVKIPAKNAVKLPSGVSYDQGAFFEPATVALHGLFVMNFRGGYDTAVVGAGTIGLLTIQCAKALGAKRIFAFDISEEKLAKAKTCGADVCLNTTSDSFRDIIRQEMGGRGFEMVIETAGVEFTEILSLEIASNKGTVMYIGTPSKNVTMKPKEFEYLNRKELTVRGSWMSYSSPFPGREWDLAGYYFQQGLLNAEPLIDRIIPLAEGAAAFHDYEIPGKIQGKILFKAGRD